MNESNHDPKTGIALVDGPVHEPDIVLPQKRRGRVSHTLSEKNLMALTGLFLCLFLLVHLLGNLQLLLPVEVAHFLRFVCQHTGSCHLCAYNHDKKPAIEWEAV
jgi:hypothetical protein